MKHSKIDFLDKLNHILAAFHLNIHQIVRYFPFFFIGVLICLKGVSNDLYWYIMAGEDGPAEDWTCLVYLVASLFALGIVIRLYKKHDWGTTAWGAVVCSIIFFVIAMEEISWGQRIFDLQSPEFFQTYNYQEEITIHNFLSRYYLHMLYIIIGIYGSFAWKFFPSQLKDKFPKIAQFIIPDRLLQWYFLPVALLYLYYDYLSVVLVDWLGWTMFQWYPGRYGWIIAKDQEPIELLLGIGIMCFMAILFNRQTHDQLL